MVSPPAQGWHSLLRTLWHPHHLALAHGARRRPVSKRAAAQLPCQTSLAAHPSFIGGEFARVCSRTFVILSERNICRGFRDVASPGCRLWFHCSRCPMDLCAACSYRQCPQQHLMQRLAAVRDGPSSCRGCGKGALQEIWGGTGQKRTKIAHCYLSLPILLEDCPFWSGIPETRYG